MNCIILDRIILGISKFKVVIKPFPKSGCLTLVSVGQLEFLVLVAESCGVQDDGTNC